MPLTGVIESIPLDRPLFPLLWLSPLTIDDEDEDDEDDDDVNGKSAEFTLELVESFPFKIGVKWFIETCSINEVP